MKKILVIIGTRPEGIKLLPVFNELRKKKNLMPLLISTGQHRQMLVPIFDFFEVQPDFDMKIMTKNQTLPQLTAQLILKCSAFFEQEKPDLIVVQGDTTTAMASSLAAFYKRIPVAHVEAGLRSHNIFSPFPEEVNRKIISTMAQLHFAPTRNSARALKKENVSGKVFMVGNTVIDALFFARKKIKKQRKDFMDIYMHLLKPFKKMVLITGHRRESFGEGFLSICGAIRKLSFQNPDVSFIYLLHLNPNVREPVMRHLANLSNVFLIEPVAYDHMVFLMSECSFILTDSGGVQEEAPSMNKPVVVMRDTTERPEGIKAGCSVLVGTSKQKIVQTSMMLLHDKRIYAKMSRIKNPYGKGDTAQKIVICISNYLLY